MTTLLMLFACIRDLATDAAAKADCQSCIYQQGSQYKNIPERNRLVFSIRDSVQDVVDKYVKTSGGTDDEAALHKMVDQPTETSLQNMAKAILEMRRFLSDKDKGITPESLLKFLLNQVLFIFVATQDLDDAFRLFTILNDRGVPLRNSDILKSHNLGALEKDSDKRKYAKLWEEAESVLGDDFDRFMNHLRTILVKEKARLSLLQEFEDKIYTPKERDKATGHKKPPLLKKGKETFQLVEQYLKHYNAVLGGNNYENTDSSFQFDNLIRVMTTGLPSSDWVPPLLRYFDKFGFDQLLEFLVKLDNKFSGDWIAQLTPTERIENMNYVIRAIEDAQDSKQVLKSSIFNFDEDGMIRAISTAVYGRRFTRYLLLKLDYIYNDHKHPMSFATLSVEHILPQSPDGNSQWITDFTAEERETLTHILGNLVLITRSKNASQGRLDFDKKKVKYFNYAINTCPNSLRVLQNTEWTPKQLKKNQKTIMNDLSIQHGDWPL